MNEKLDEQVNQMRDPGRHSTENRGLLFQEQTAGGTDRLCKNDRRRDGEKMNINPMMQEQLRQLQSNPKEFIRKTGANIPEELMNDPKAMVMHMINTNQVSNPILQMVQPMIRQMGGR